MEKIIKKPEAESVLLAIFAAVTVGFFIPYDFYIGNFKELLLPQKYIVTAIALTSILVFAVVFLLDRLTAGRNSIVMQTINTLIFAVLSGFYVQGNFLSINMGEMDGSRYNPGILRVVINALFWCVLLAGILIFSRKKPGIYRKAVPYVSAAITIIQIITAAISYILTGVDAMNDVFIDNWMKEKRNFICSMSDMNTYSTNENFIIILADEYDSFAFDSAATQCPEALDEFDGFTYYRNTLGMYSNTVPSVAYIFTGSESDVPDPYDHDEFFENLSKRFEVYLYAGPSQLLDTKIYEKYAVNYLPADFTARDIIRTQTTLLKVTMFKCSPEIFKGVFWFSNDSFSGIIGGTEDIRSYMPDNLSFYNNIPEEIELTDENCFKLIYLSGLHDPRSITADLQRAKQWSISPEEQAIAVNKIMNKYFGLLKEFGVYDNSTIIFLADHGLRSNDSGKYPLLMYKPANAVSKGITVSDAPISHIDLYPTLIALSGGTPDGRTIFEIGEDEQRTRYFSDTSKFTGNIKSEN